MANPVDRLAEAAKDLAGMVAALDREATNRQVVLAKQTKRNRSMIWWLIVLGAILVAVAVLAGFAYSGVVSNTNRLNTSETVGRQKALCPLYQLLIDGNTTKARAVSPDKAVYDRTYKVINEGYDALNCSQFKGSAPRLG